MSAAKKVPKALPKLSPASFRNTGSGRANLASPISPEERELGWLKVRVERAQGLAAKDRNGKSDPFVVMHVGANANAADDRQEKETKVTSEVKWGTLDPVWWSEDESSATGAAEMVFPVWPSTLATERIEIVLFDKDKLGKDYLGEVSLAVDEWFCDPAAVEAHIAPDAKTEPVVGWGEEGHKPRWHHLRSSKRGSKVSGSILVRVGFVDPRQAGVTTSKAAQAFGLSHGRANEEAPFTNFELAHIIKVAQLEHAEGVSRGEVRAEAKRSKGWKQGSKAALGGMGRQLRRAGGVGAARFKRGERVLMAPPTEGVGTTGAAGVLSGKDLSAGIGMGEDESDSEDDSDTATDFTDDDTDAGMESPEEGDLPRPGQGRETSAPPTTGVGTGSGHLAPPSPATQKKGLSLPGFIRRSTGGSMRQSSVDSGPPTPTNELSSLTLTTHQHGEASKAAKKRFRKKKQSTAESDADGLTQQEKVQRRKTKRRQKRLLRRKSDYSFHQGGDDDVLGLCFIEVKSATGLPKWRNMTRTGFDMDPFAIISFGQRIFRTRVIRHSLDPKWDEKLFFHVKRHEMAFQILISVFDWDKMTSNDFVGDCTVPITDLMAKAPQPDAETGLYRADANGGLEGDQLFEFEVQLHIAERPDFEIKNEATVKLRAKFTPFEALRQIFWRRYMRQYDTDDSSTLSYVELFLMLDSLGSTLSKKTIESFFTRFGKTPEAILTEDEVVICLEAELMKPRDEKAPLDPHLDSGMVTPALGKSTTPLDLSDNVGQAMGFTGPNAMTAINPKEQEEEVETLEPFDEPLDKADAREEGHAMTEAASKGGPTTGSLHPPIVMGAAAGTPPSASVSRQQSVDDLDEAGDAADIVERVINISKCPLCHKDRIDSRLEIDLVTHLAVCASQDWSTLDRIPVGNFVTASQAHRKWFTKVITKVQNGQYQLGANSANIIVQDRITGQLLEEKMQVYVRAGIRLMYKGLGSSRMEGNRIRKLLLSMSIKQGKKFNAPESVKDIAPFIAFHNLDMTEVLDPISSFKNFNEFFYRKLKPDARPVANPDDPGTLVSCADCRMMAFPTVSEATRIWIKGREFGVSRLLGERYGKDTAAYEGGALAIFRLAPQDYHRFHSPVDGVVGEMEKISGQYYTVNPMAIRSAVDVYGENVRMIVPIDTEAFGRVYSVHIGAMMVGSIVMLVKPGDRVERGQDIGYFAFGGSTIVTIFPENTVRWDEDLLTNGQASTETLVKVGMKVGKSVRGQAMKPTKSGSGSSAVSVSGQQL